jgi:hypothetical protein
MTAITSEDRAAERGEKARLRSLRWRRAHGIGPRKPAARPWLALGISRSTYYRRRAKAREQAALAAATAAREAVLDRLDWQLAELRASLERCAVAHGRGVGLSANDHFESPKRAPALRVPLDGKAKMEERK